MSKNERRNYLINPKFQLTVLGFFVGLAVVTIGVFYWAIRLVFSNLNEQATALNLPPDHAVVVMIGDNLRAMDMIFLTTSILLFLFLVLGGLILSHQIAGPIYRLRKHIQMVNEGKTFGALTFRKKDFFQELLEDYNTLVDKVRK